MRRILSATDKEKLRAEVKLMKRRLKEEYGIRTKKQLEAAYANTFINIGWAVEEVKEE